jgi:iron complex outermembrane receptor protein
LQEVEVRGRTIQSYKSDYTFLSTKTQTAFKDEPQTVSTITKEMISDRMEFTLKEAADEAAGVNHCSGYDDYTILGFKAENARLINGLRGYNTTYTSTMLVHVERIEVIKGPSATLYGNCDPGGTINLVTKKPLATNKAELNFSGGTWNHFRAQGDITGPVNKSKTLLYWLNAGYDNTGSFRDEMYANSYEIAPSLSFIPNNKYSSTLIFLYHISTLFLTADNPDFNMTFR